MNLIDKHAPLRERVVIVRPKAPWYNSEIDKAKRMRRKLEHKWLKTKSQIDHDNFRQQCAVVNDLILISKETFYNGNIENCDGDQKLLFKVIDKILHNNDEPQLPSHNSFNELVNKFADSFTEKIQSIREQITGTDAVNSVFDDEMFSLVLNCHLSYQLVKMRCASLYRDQTINPVAWIPSLHSLSSCVWMNSSRS